jgi:hypothetical protein
MGTLVALYYIFSESPPGNFSYGRLLQLLLASYVLCADFSFQLQASIANKISLLAS